MVNKNLPRAIRNKNLGNLRTGSSWFGLEGWDAQGFVRFNTFQNGIRACVKLMQTYRSRGLDTIRKILQSYAPEIENNTKGYIVAVSSKTDIDYDEVLSQDDYIKVLIAIFEVECGMDASAIQSMCIDNGANPRFDLYETVSNFVETFIP